MKIKSVRAEWIHVPIPEAQQHVSDFGRVTSFDCVLVRVETECGIVGYGEAKEEVGSSGNYRTLQAAINERLGPLLIGEDPRDISRLWDRMYNGTRDHYALARGRGFPILGRRGVTVSAIGGIDIALWDILGKSLGAPVWRLIGGRRAPRMPAYASGGWQDVARIGEQLAGYVEKGGFKAVKMRVGVIDGSARRSAERVRAARAALGGDVMLMCDAHGTFDVPEAKAFCRLVEDCDVAWFEEPVTADDRRGYAEVRGSTSIAIAAGESEFSRFDFLDLAERRCVDILQPDLAICGGLTEGMRIAAIASAYGLRLAPHLWTGATAFAAGLHLAAASSCGYILEYSLGANPLLHELVEESPEVSDGMVEVPDRPGLGLTIRPDFVERFAVRH
ncbi:mandelate racemase/muconate lactonizing enzyme family protein [Bradyrhizobium sp. U87765 SZCCT0131]|uniref:mandelate racemase/muconate lactonizing enzyme family protein n=1 Tax=unclassified Bradyrhizobium TaxID=2631580 RepID=UPI001BA4C8D9|nr:MULTISPECIES: mandelate racemase/muconate lactonizing enzyme family protein [unclassified Bradyrhizobium]MBR1222987.1 mandelate racemase/muconate lactonizing enzyme family protein [Bradyrhizobium sp. U87765 SZCCT0131]MBR1262723.1 mandelate racemase/muconate lactonizing enzyme family protein [Bradyrhizobium sp. U87765 SZCCT0134]MBR1308805.1 mandelate racemase/muconate lactonizing enzyme family protein [Bradyrhizobium sp. U87765 SZCCT0110]MBR1318505.1 mandelate racemase/muconate lactonizing en